MFFVLLLVHLLHVGLDDIILVFQLGLPCALITLFVASYYGFHLHLAVHLLVNTANIMVGACTDITESSLWAVAFVAMVASSLLVGNFNYLLL